MRPFSLTIPVKTALCFISNFPLSHIKQRRTHLCSNPNYGRATTSIEPLLIHTAAGFPEMNRNISSAFMIRNARNFSTSTWIPFWNTSKAFILPPDALHKTRRRSCAPLSFSSCFLTRLLLRPASRHG